jgi:hydroxymethylpyrimidine pyrophosphatase-like HAD family hydrolase
MRYVCLTCDYDGTIARNGRVSSSTLQALEKVRASGRKLILATGRELPDLLAVVPEASLFDRIVVENGGVLYRPSSKEQVVLADPPPALYCAGVAACRSNTQQGDICTWEISGGRSSKCPEYHTPRDATGNLDTQAWLQGARPPPESTITRKK